MHNILQKLSLVKNQVNEIINRKQLKTNPKIIVVTKTFSLDYIKPLIESGHIHFGENKIQEAENKWINVKTVIVIVTVIQGLIQLLKVYVTVRTVVAKNQKVW